MKNLMILYNPYYNIEVIEDHIRILNKSTDVAQAKVAFGKVRSRRRDYEHPFGDQIDELCDSITSNEPLQLFLTDFSSMYVCYIENVTKELDGIEAPKYYDDLEVDRWFIVSDIRELARNDFEYIRDHIITNFITPNFGGYTYTLYGNRYDYPLVIEQKNGINYFESFEEGDRHFTRVFKNSQYAEVQNSLIHYVYGKDLFYKMHPDSQESLISAELNYLMYKDNATHDFSTIVINYGKVFENESYYFLKDLFTELLKYDEALESIEYQVQGQDFLLTNYLHAKPNMGTNKYLLSHSKIFHAYTAYYDDRRKYAPLLNLLKFELKNAISTIQSVRNEASHGGMISKQECDDVRAVMLGIGQSSIIAILLENRKQLKK